jgi:hypothetical protein
VVLEGVRAANEVWDACFAEIPNDGAIDLSGANIVGRVQNDLTHVVAKAKRVPGGGDR